MPAAKVMQNTQRTQVCRWSTAAYQIMVRMTSERNVKPRYTNERIRSTMPVNTPSTESRIKTIGSTHDSPNSRMNSVLDDTYIRLSAR